MHNPTSFLSNTLLRNSKRKVILRNRNYLKILKGTARRLLPDSDVVGVTEATGICGTAALEKEL